MSAIAELVSSFIADAGPVVTGSAQVRAAAPASTAGVVLAADELSHAEHDAEWLIDRAAQVLVGGGHLVVTAAGVPGPSAGRVFTAEQLAAALHHRGFTVVHGPELSDSRHVAVARAPKDGAERSRVFFATLPRKVVAAGAVCTSSTGKMLIVFDRFLGHWTVPGGVVDPDESPAVAARRETWEESGLHVTVGDLLGVFHYTEPDRLLMLYAATANGEPAPAPVHTHEVSDAKWVAMEEALSTVNPRKAAELRSALGM